MTREEEAPPEASGFRLRPRPRARSRALLTAKAVGNAVPLLLANLARGSNGTLKCAPPPGGMAGDN